MKQPQKRVKNAVEKPKKRKHKYGTSRLERDFARDFLDKNGIRYVYQYCAKDIGRYYDFAISAHNEFDYKMETKDGVHCIRQEGQPFTPSLLIEVDGGYFHGDPRVLKGKKLTTTQQKNRRIDEQKNTWAQEKNIPLLRIWEFDIKNNPKLVETLLSEFVKLKKKSQKTTPSARQPHKKPH